MNAVVTACECATAGFCPRHRCNKTEHFVRLCAERPEYFALWEAGKGPCIHGTPADGVPLATPRKSRGLGDVVAKALDALGIRKTAGCGCVQRRDWLNQILPFGARAKP
jgi:hypothetical protein